MCIPVDVHDYLYMWQNIKYIVNITHRRDMEKAQGIYFLFAGSARP